MDNTLEHRILKECVTKLMDFRVKILGGVGTPTAARYPPEKHKCKNAHRNIEF
jgi:hypothetical protein